jgi:glutamate-5-semialdehyde dehydrogenase
MQENFMSAAEQYDDAQDIKTLMTEMGRKAREAYRILANTPPADKNKALFAAAAALRANEKTILEANHKDLKAAATQGISGSFIDRLELSPERIEGIAQGLEDIAGLDDPVGHTLASWKRPNGLTIERVSVPLGVIGIIYESRPNVTADAGGLCLKSGNAAILRGGSDSFHSSRAIFACLKEGLEHAGLPVHAIQLIPTKDRAAVGEMLKLDQYIDVIVPRGGRGLIERITKESSIPLFKHLDGNCHTYIHEKADAKKAVDVVVNAKMRRTGICGATESLVIDTHVAEALLPSLVDALSEKSCELRGDAKAVAIDSRIKAASDEDWDTEYLDAILSVRIVKDFHEAIAFVNTHSSHHTDAIITENQDVADQFLAQVDSAIVMHNTSTQFADGGEFGMGAEIGISTGRMHARGPVGVEQLTTYKYLVSSKGATRS